MNKSVETALKKHSFFNICFFSTHDLTNINTTINKLADIPPPPPNLHPRG